MKPERDRPFWQDTPFERLSHEQWEAICDGCGRCCLNKLEDEDTGEIYQTCVACNQLDIDTGRCRDYDNRFTIEPECILVTPDVVRESKWLPPTCSYVILLREGDLPPWHPLVSGNPESVANAGLRVYPHAVSEAERGERDYAYYIIDWDL